MFCGFMQVIYDRMTSRSRGFGFVTMRTVEEAEKAVQLFNQYVSLLWPCRFEIDVCYVYLFVAIDGKWVIKNVRRRIT